MIKSLMVASLILAGCGRGEAVRSLVQQSPVVATDGGTAILHLTACPTQQAGAEILGDVIQNLMSQGTVVRASDNATARLVINACPYERVEQPTPTRERRRPVGGT